MGYGLVSKFIIALCSVLKMAISTAIVIIVSSEFYRVTLVAETKDGRFTLYQTECLLAGSVSKRDTCDYVFAVCGLSMLLSLLSALLLCFTCNSKLCGRGTCLDVVLPGLQTAMWVIAAAIISQRVARINTTSPLPDGTPLPGECWRNAVAVLAWIAALLAGVTTTTITAEACGGCFGCCGDESPQYLIYQADNPSAVPQPHAASASHLMPQSDEDARPANAI